MCRDVVGVVVACVVVRRTMVKMTIMNMLVVRSATATLHLVCLDKVMLKKMKGFAARGSS
tara:strand:- start:850 stop:1029 length:180 start_codon:yes stop_codon:yes gene_type:complete